MSKKYFLTPVLLMTGILLIGYPSFARINVGSPYWWNPDAIGTHLGGDAQKLGFWCKKIDSRQLSDAIDQAKRQLEKNGCRKNFDIYFASLLDVAEGDPGPQNKQSISQFLEWSVVHGVTNRKIAERIYNGLFNSKFITLMDEEVYNFCSLCQRKDLVRVSMEEELTIKERGLQRICNDVQSYQAALRLYEDFRFVGLEATCSACQQNQYQ